MIRLWNCEEKVYRIRILLLVITGYAVIFLIYRLGIADIGR